MPITSCGTTWPIDRIRSWPPCQTSLLSCAGQGLVQMPSVTSVTNSAGTWPTVTTSFRQSCSRIRSFGSPGNMRSNCQSGIGTCVPRAGITSTSRAAEILVGHARQRPGHAVGPGEVGRQGQHPLARAEFVERLRQARAHVARRKIGRGGTLGKKGGHRRGVRGYAENLHQIPS